MLYLNDKDVQTIINVKDLIPYISNIFKKEYEGKVKVLDRQRLVSNFGVLDLMGAVDEEDKLAVTKTYFYGANSDFIITLYDTITSEAILIVRGKKLTQIRTAAVSAVATKNLSSKDANILAIIGTGFQAEEQIIGILAVREIDSIYVYDKNINKAKEFIDKMTKRTGKEMILKQKIDQDFKKAQIILTATVSETPVIDDEFINESAYINSIGSYKIDMSELYPETVCSSRIIVVDSLKQAIKESGEIYQSLHKCLKIEEINELKDIFGEGIKIRNSSTNRIIFKSVGSAIEDLIAAKVVYLKVDKMNIGKKLD